MKRLFDEKEGWTEESRALDVELAVAISPVIRKWADSGYSLRDIHYVAEQSVHDSCISLIIARS
jgi:hypothetical protein